MEATTASHGRFLLLSVLPTTTGIFELCHIQTQSFRIQRDFSPSLRRCQSSLYRTAASSKLIHIDCVHSRAAIHSRVVQSPLPFTPSSIAENPEGKSGARRLESEPHPCNHFYIWQVDVQAVELEETAVKLLALNETPLEEFMKSIEHEWIGTRQQQILSDCRQCLEQCSQEGVLYDPSRENDGVFDVLNWFGTVQKDIEESIEKLLCFPPCKISPSYHTLVLRMHSAVKEAIQLKE